MTQIQQPVRPVPPVAPSRFARADVEDFLFYEADLLDAWAEEWRDLFTPDGRYVVPPTDDPNGDPDVHLALVNDDEEGRRGRVQRLMSTPRSSPGIALRPPSRSSTSAGITRSPPWKTAVIMQQLYDRYRRGETSNPRMAGMSDRVARLGRRALDLLAR
jgi:hypothetical protein